MTNPAMPDRHGLMIWQLRRIHDAQASYRQIGVRSSRRPFDSWWDPGAIWAVKDPADALEFTAFQIGVTLREVGGQVLLADVAERFGLESPVALPWLVGIWAGLQPNSEAREAFVAKFGGVA